MNNKVIFVAKVAEYVSTLYLRFKIADKPDLNSIKELILRYKKTEDNMSHSDAEKSLACAYLTQKFGIPIKSSAAILNIEQAKVFRLFKKFNILSYDYIKNFIDYLMRFEPEEYKQRYVAFFNRVKNKTPDLFIAAVALNISLKREVADDKSFMPKDNDFEYSDTTLGKYRKIIREELNG